MVLEPGRTIYPKIGEVFISLTEGLKTKDLSERAIELAKNYDYDFGITAASLNTTFLSKFRQGYIWGEGNPRMKQAKRQMERLEWILMAVPISQDHEIIAMLKQATNTLFQYRPQRVNYKNKTVKELLNLT
jgi:hypothetical protein